MTRTFHVYNHTVCTAGLSPSKMARGDVFTITEAFKASEGPACCGGTVNAPAGKYKVVSRKSFRGGTQECELVEELRA